MAIAEISYSLEHYQSHKKTYNYLFLRVEKAEQFTAEELEIGAFWLTPK